jgi:hypothetical protein
MLHGRATISGYGQPSRPTLVSFVAAFQLLSHSSFRLERGSKPRIQSTPMAPTTADGKRRLHQSSSKSNWTHGSSPIPSSLGRVHQRHRITLNTYNIHRGGRGVAIQTNRRDSTRSNSRRRIIMSDATFLTLHNMRTRRRCFQRRCSQ